MTNALAASSVVDIRMILPMLINAANLRATTLTSMVTHGARTPSMRSAKGTSTARTTFFVTEWTKME
jgi:hypothetical protein